MCWPFDAVAALVWMELRRDARQALRRLRRTSGIDTRRKAPPISKAR